MDEEHPRNDGKPRIVLRYVTTFRRRRRAAFLVFCFSAITAAQLRPGHHRAERQRGHAGVHQSNCNRDLTASVPGARMDARQLLTNPLDYPIEIRVSSNADVNAQHEAEDNRTLRKIAGTSRRHLPLHSHRRAHAQRVGRREPATRA